MKDCKICGGTGWEIREENKIKVCYRCANCYHQSTVKKRLELALIPSKYELCTFESYKTSRLHPSQKKAKDIALRFVEEYPVDTSVGLFFIGPCGVGKTHLAVATMRGLIEKGFSCIFYDFRDLLKKLQHSYNSETDFTEYDVLKPVLERDILVLDELGALKTTSWTRDILNHIMNRRYNDNKITIITSNYLDNPSGPGKSKDEDETLTDRIGYRLRSRLNEMCRIVIMEGEDHRKIYQDSLQSY